MFDGMLIFVSKFSFFVATEKNRETVCYLKAVFCALKLLYKLSISACFCQKSYLPSISGMISIEPFMFHHAKIAYVGR